jgi:hypothetical protein
LRVDTTDGVQTTRSRRDADGHSTSAGGGRRGAGTTDRSGSRANGAARPPSRRVGSRAAAAAESGEGTRHGLAGHSHRATWSSARSASPQRSRSQGKTGRSAPSGGGSGGRFGGCASVLRRTCTRSAAALRSSPKRVSRRKTTAPARRRTRSDQCSDAGEHDAHICSISEAVPAVLRGPRTRRTDRRRHAVTNGGVHAPPFDWPKRARDLNATRTGTRRLGRTRAVRGRPTDNETGCEEGAVRRHTHRTEPETL